MACLFRLLYLVICNYGFVGPADEILSQYYVLNDSVARSNNLRSDSDGNMHFARSRVTR